MIVNSRSTAIHLWEGTHCTPSQRTIKQIGQMIVMSKMFSISAKYVNDSSIKSNASWQVSESGVTERTKCILTRPYLLLAKREYSGGMICFTISYITTQISNGPGVRIMTVNGKDRRQTGTSLWTNTAHRLFLQMIIIRQRVPFGTGTCGTSVLEGLKSMLLWSFLTADHSSVPTVFMCIMRKWVHLYSEMHF